jgi:group I intron endonuclease
MGYIYKITNISTKKSYVGQTTEQDVNDRWKDHLKKSSNCRQLKKSLQEYGKENFVFSIICICFDDDLNRFEIEYINHFNTIYPNGYNIRSGGNNGKHSKETRLKISETIKDLYKNNKIIKAPKAPWITSQLVKDKISKGVKKYYENHECVHKGVSKKSSCKAVIQSKDGNDIETFKNLTEAAKKLNVSIAAVCMVAKGKRHSVLGFEFRYKV